MNRIVSVLMAVVLVFMLAACGGGTTTSEPINTGTSEVQSTVNENDVPTESSEPNVEPTTVEDDADPLGALLITEEYARENSSICLLKDGKLYSLSYFSQYRPDYEYGDAGIRLERNNIYMYTSFLLDEDDGFSSCGVVPIPVMDDQSKIVLYSDNTVSKLRLLQVERRGFSICLSKNASNIALLDLESGDWISSQSRKMSNLKVYDTNDNVIDDYHDLEYGQKCMVSWYEGTQYYELPMEAICNYYVLPNGNTSVNSYETEGILTKEGYAEYDVSDVAPGLYMVASYGGLIEFK